MKSLFVLVLLGIGAISSGQELYVFSEPASNLPAKSLSVKLQHHLVTSNYRSAGLSHRLMPQVYAGINKKLMVGAGATFSNMHTSAFRYESFNVYTKYRFLSNEGLHKHFRMAAFADFSGTRSPFHFDEINLMGDKGGIEAGIIATQLVNKLAVSATVSHTQVLHSSRTNKVLYIPARNYQSINYSLSAGYLVLPKEYTDYRQTNFNVYLEVLGQQTLDRSRYFVDLAPAFQFIFNSNAKLNIGYRFQLGGTMDRMSSNSWQLSFERTLLNAFGKNK